jgi:hypothetical protein
MFCRFLYCVIQITPGWLVPPQILHAEVDLVGRPSVGSCPHRVPNQPIIPPQWLSDITSNNLSLSINNIVQLAKVSVVDPSEVQNGDATNCIRTEYNGN